jgi:hypothetical protein
LKFAFDSSNCTGAVSATISGGATGTWSFRVKAPAAGYHILAVCDSRNPAVFGYSTSFAVRGQTNGYVGVCDPSAGNCAPSTFVGMRAYSATYAGGFNLAGKVQRADGLNFYVPMLANGYADQADAVAFAGKDATFTGSISGTTLTVTAVSSGALHVNDQLSGANIADPTYITDIGTCGSPPGTCTVNKSQTASSGTMTATVALYWTMVREQISNDGASDASQSTPANMPIFLARCNGAQEPCWDYGPSGGRYFVYGGNANNKFNSPPFSVVAWVRPVQITSGQHYGTFGSIANILQVWGTPEFSINGTANLELSNQTNQAVASTGTVSTGALTDVAVTLDNSNNWVFYAGGAGIGSGNTRFALQGYWGGVGAVAAAGRGAPGSSPDYANGGVTYIATFGSALSSATLAALHAAGG